jgi:hypothetical protein
LSSDGLLAAVFGKFSTADSEGADDEEVDLVPWVVLEIGVPLAVVLTELYPDRPGRIPVGLGLRNDRLEAGFDPSMDISCESISEFSRHICQVALCG